MNRLSKFLLTINLFEIIAVTNTFYVSLELKNKLIDVKKGEDHKIIVITGNKKRHQRFAYRIQKRVSKPGCSLV